MPGYDKIEKKTRRYDIQKNATAIVLAMLMAVQTPVMAGEIVAADEIAADEIVAEPVQENTAFQNILIEEDIPEVTSEVSLVEDELLEDGELPEESIEADVISEESLKEELPSAGATSGQCGDNVFWTFDSDGVLTVFGTGSMWEWEWNSDIPDYNIPWLDIKGKKRSLLNQV